MPGKIAAPFSPLFACYVRQTSIGGFTTLQGAARYSLYPKCKNRKGTIFLRRPLSNIAAFSLA